MASGTAASADEAALRALIERWHEATRAGDVDALVPLMTEDVVFLAAGAPPLEGRVAFLAALRGALARVRIESVATVREIAAAGEWAWVRAELAVRMEPRAGGPAMERRGPVLSVFRRAADGGWALHRDANLLAPPAASR